MGEVKSEYYLSLLFYVSRHAKEIVQFSQGESGARTIFTVYSNDVQHAIVSLKIVEKNLGALMKVSINNLSLI